MGTSCHTCLGSCGGTCFWGGGCGRVPWISNAAWCRYIWVDDTPWKWMRKVCRGYHCHHDNSTAQANGAWAMIGEVRGTTKPSWWNNGTGPTWKSSGTHIMFMSRLTDNLLLAGWIKNQLTRREVCRAQEVSGSARHCQEGERWAITTGHVWYWIPLCKSSRGQ